MLKYGGINGTSCMSFSCGEDRGKVCNYHCGVSGWNLLLSSIGEISKHVCEICKFRDKYCKSFINLELHMVHVFLYACITAIEIMPC